MKKIYIVSWYGIDTGGLERVMGYLNNILYKKYNIEIVDLKSLQALKLYKVIKLLKMNQIVFVNAVFTSLYLYLNKTKKDIVITNGFNAPFIGSDFLFAHGSMAGVKSSLNLNIYNIYTFLECVGAYKAKNVIAVSELTKKEYIKYYKTNSSKIKVLNNCVNSENFYPIKKEYDDIINVLFCGRLNPLKGIETLLLLTRKVEKLKNIKLTIATGSKINTDLFKKFSNTKVIVDLNISQLNEFYNSGDVLFFPSIYEGFEMVTLEALSCGIPVVGNNIGALSELARNNFMGTTILKTKNLNNIIDILISEANKFKNYELRKKLHEEVKKKFDINIYEQKINHMFNKYL